MPESPFSAPDRIEFRGGDGPPQPVWLDVQTYSTEWYRRYRSWHYKTYPESDPTSRANLDMLVQIAEERDVYRVEADCAMRDYDDLELDYGRLKEKHEAAQRDRDELLARTVRQPPHDYSSMGF